LIGDLDKLIFTPDPNFSGDLNFTWNGFDGTDYALNTAQAKLSIAPLPRITINSVDAAEPTTVGKFNLSRTGDLTQALTVNYALSGTATNGTDYQTTADTVTFTAGQNTASIDITPIDDKTYEGPETVTLTLNPSPNYQLNPNPSATIAIADNDSELAIEPTNQVLSLKGLSSPIAFQITSLHPNKFTEIGFFNVDDDQGTIAGLKLSDSGYTTAAMQRARSIFSSLPTSSLPTGFNGLTNRTLNLPTGTKGRFFALTSGSIDQLSTIPPSNIIFSNPTTLDLNTAPNGELNLNWKSPIDLKIAAKLLDAAPTIGTNSQNNLEGEIIDLRNLTTDVTATFSIYREAYYNNHVYFYNIQDTQGTILDTSTNKTLKPGDTDYLKTALRNAVAGLDLSTPNQAVTTQTATLNKGQLFAPIIVIDGDKSSLIDDNPANDRAAYSPFLLGNADKTDHIRLLGDNTFGFEDLAGGGDRDYNDIIVKATFTTK
jgi:hypothetical protein